MLRCEADLSVDPVFNLDFHDAGFICIPFHLSLRRDEGLAVVNRRDAAGWRREISFRRDFAPGAVDIDIRFGRLQVALRLDGKVLGRFDRFPRPAREGRLFLRRGFPGLERIAHVGWVGVMVPGSLRLDSAPVVADWAGRGLAVSDRMEAVWRGLDRAAAARLAGRGLRLWAEGLERPLELPGQALPYLLPGGEPEHALSALLPGRIWAGGAARVALRLVDGAGAILAETAVTRDGLRKGVEQQAGTPLLRHDDLAALQALEHVRHAGLAAELSPQTRAELAACADYFGLTGWFQGDGRPVHQRAVLSGEAARAHAARFDQSMQGEGAEGRDPIQVLRDRFTGPMRANPAQDSLPLLAGLLDAAALAPEAERMAFTVLTEWFCTHHDPRALHALARARGHPRFVADTGNAWHLSASLPMLYLQGQFDDVAHACRQLAGRRRGWLVTQALAWVADQARQGAPDAAGRAPGPAQRAAMLAGFLDALIARAGDYWERVPCLALLRACAALALDSPALPEGMAARVRDDVLRLYALSPAFWAEIEARQSASQPALPEGLAEAGAAFRALSALIEAGPADGAAARGEVASALARFQPLCCFDLPRFRRDLLGPLQAPTGPGAMPAPADGLTEAEQDEALLRWLAHPRPASARPEMDDAQAEALAGAAGRAVAAGWHGVPHDPQRAALADLSRRALALAEGVGDSNGLHDPERRGTGGKRALESPFARAFEGASPRADRSDPPETEPDEALSQWIDDLAALGASGGTSAGLTLTLRLAVTLLHRGDEAGARQLLTAVAAMPAQTRAEMLTETGPALAAAALARAPGGAGMAATLGIDSTDLPASTCRAGLLRTPARHLFDTLVCVYTCRANLDTRIKVLRQTWLADLQRLGVPFLIFTGDGAGEREGDIVHLDAPDDYEGLPQKTLALARWVLGQTDFSYLLKVDDDCFLDAETFLFGLAHMAHDYHGRRLHRVRGQMDRTWHTAKARSPRGRLELDKSPEPSLYADGGSAYALSRRAMAALGRGAASGPGRALIQRSFMEDKLVGDLLALSGIQVAQDDYRVAVMRRSRPGGPLVPQWENGFLPFRGAGISLAHLDGTEPMAAVQAGRAGTWPQPMKIWPSFQPLRLGARSNALDLISAPERLAGVASAPVAVVACLRNEAFMLPHFLAHYRALGVEGFLIADNGSDDGSLDILAEAPDVALFSVDTEYGQSQYGVAWQQALLAHFRCDRWSLVADADELLIPGEDWQAAGLPGLVQGADFAQADAARVFMLDMYPQGPLSDATFASDDPFIEARHVERAPFLTVSGSLGPYSQAPVFTSALRHRLIPGSRAELFVAQKYALLRYRPWMRPSAGLHFVAEARPAARDLLFAHFKYNAAFRAKSMEEVARRQHFNDAEEYRKYLALASEGREVIFDAAVSVPWSECDFVKRVLAEGKA